MKDYNCKKCKDRNWLVECKCGCGYIQGYRDYKWRVRNFKAGHNTIVTDQREEKNAYWKGDDVGLQGLHKWVRRYLPEPELCDECHKVPPYDLANITGVYNRDFINWQYLCRRCHIHSDGRLKQLDHRMDMTGRQCEKCGSYKTHIIRGNSHSYGRPLWRHWEGKLLCYKCYRRQYFLKSGK